MGKGLKVYLAALTQGMFTINLDIYDYIIVPILLFSPHRLQLLPIS